MQTWVVIKDLWQTVSVLSLLIAVFAFWTGRSFASLRKRVEALEKNKADKRLGEDQ